MSKIRILVIDDSIALTNEIQKYFSSHAVMEVTHICHTGEEGLKYIERENNYDVILLDMVMPNKDGMYVLRELKNKNIQKNIIVLSTYSNDKVIRNVSDYGISYYLLKPFLLNELETVIENSIKINNFNKAPIQDGNLEYEITKLLHQLGMPSHIKGYLYIREGIHMIYQNSNYMGAITKELYPDIANKYETSASRVERAIRHAIEVSWNRGNYDLMEEIFGQSYSYDKSKPTNSEFIVTLADKLKLDSKRVVLNT